MSNVTELSDHRGKHHEPAFEMCPRCNRYDGCLNLDREHWFYCEVHKQRWCIGSNLFSGWREENNAIWRDNHATLSQFPNGAPLPPLSAFDDEQAEYGDPSEVPF